MIPPAVRQMARHLLSELDAGWLEVIKVPWRDGYKRALMSENTEWYREFCRQFEFCRKSRRYRKPRTIIKRCWTRTALLHLADGQNGTLYSGRLLDFIRHWMEEHEGEFGAVPCAAPYIGQQMPNGH